MRNIENTSVESLIQKLAESKGTGKERPGKPPHSCMFDANDQCLSVPALCVNKIVVRVMGPLPIPALWGWEGCIERGN